MVFTAYVKQFYALGMAHISVGILSLILSALMIKYYKNAIKYADDNFSHGSYVAFDRSATFAFFWNAAIVVLIITTFVVIPKGLIYLLSPEYYAIKNLIYDISVLVN